VTIHGYPPFAERHVDRAAVHAARRKLRQWEFANAYGYRQLSADGLVDPASGDRRGADSDRLCPAERLCVSIRFAAAG
jgi:hypothetical protein